MTFSLHAPSLFTYPYPFTTARPSIHAVQFILQNRIYPFPTSTEYIPSSVPASLPHGDVHVYLHAPWLDQLHWADYFDGGYRRHEYPYEDQSLRSQL